MKTIDNINNRLIEDLKNEIKKGRKLSIAASSFSIYAFQALKKELSSIDDLKFIFTTPTFIKEKKHNESKDSLNHQLLSGSEFELRFKNNLNQRAIAQECSNWVKEKVTFKSNKYSNLPLQNVIHLDKGGKEDYAYNGMDGFTTIDLGLSHRKGFPTLITKSGFPQSKAYLDWFNQVWHNHDSLVDVTSFVQEYFESAYQDNSPEFIYFITLYNIFNDFLSDISLDSIPDDEIGFKQTQIWQMLYNFQKDAVIGAINKLEKYNGCIIADSVGLGKTFSALGVIKYYEKRNKDVLVLCPKKLEANWNTFRHNDKNNMLAKDRFRYDVLFHTDLTREKGMSNGRNLAHVNWGNYGLIVIDESHNFRNNNTYSKNENRYQRLMRMIIQEGIETKVLMLSATPVNNRFNDLKNQLALAYEGYSGNIDGKLNTTKGIDQIFKRAQQSFNTWSRLRTKERTTQKLLELLDFDFFEILDSLTIARSRKHITSYYDTSEIGKFPTRNKPISIQSALTDSSNIEYTSIAERLSLLNLSVYSPLGYILPSKVKHYADLYDIKVKSSTFSQVDRERSLQILMRINLLKRLESSVHSFGITLRNILVQIEDALKTIKKGKTISDMQATSMIEDIDWDPDWGDEESIIGRKVKVHISDIDLTRWKEDLSADLYIIQDLLELINPIKDLADTKLQHLKRIINEKIQHPINKDNVKVLVFTAFADTANYLYGALKKDLKHDVGLNTALITGTKKQCTTRSIPSEINTMLTCFSPKSKRKDLLYPDIKDSIDVLIATDCISEGQNLQDCDFLVNYDIHWNPVRIVQRFGRIDRIGSQNESITLVNFWPDITLDTYINLKQRVENRMMISNMASTGDDNILNTEEKDLEYRSIQLKKLKEEIMDLEDLKEGVSITDLGLNDFRIDLTNLLKQYGKPKNIPDGLHAISSARYDLEPGVIFILKNINEELKINKSNRLHPYYLVYLEDNGNLKYNHVDAKNILDSLRLLCNGKQSPDPDLCQLFSKQTDNYQNMEKYSVLLRNCIANILQVDEEKDMLSLFKSGGTTIFNDSLKGIDDFKLVSFLIIL